jgi:hypothetical protein
MLGGRPLTECRICQDPKLGYWRQTGSGEEHLLDGDDVNTGRGFWFHRAWLE